MEFKEEMKYFEAVTYDNQLYHFAVTPKDEIYCDIIYQYCLGNY